MLSLKPGNYAGWLVSGGGSVFEESNLAAHRGTLTPASVPSEQEWVVPASADVPSAHGSADRGGRAHALSEPQEVVCGPISVACDAMFLILT